MIDGTPVLNGISVTVNDMKASLTFYRRLGVAMPKESEWRSNDGAAHHVAVEMPGGLAFELDSVAMKQAYDPAWKGSSASGTITLIFSFPSRVTVDETYAELTSAGYAGHLAPFDAFWGARYAVIEDPDRNHVGIMSPMEEQYQSAPPPL